MRIIIFVFSLLLLGCSTKSVQSIKLTNEEKNINISKNGNFLFYAYLENGSKLIKISKHIRNYNKNIEIIRVYDNGYYPIYDDIYGVEKCNYTILNEQKRFCNSFYTIKASENAKNFLAKVILKTAGGKIFSKYKFKTSIIKSGLSKVKTFLQKNYNFSTLGVIQPKKITNMLTLTTVDKNINQLILFDEKNNFKGIIDIKKFKQEKNIFKAVSNLTEKLLNMYLISNKPIDITIPQKIPKPKLPPKPIFTKNELETKAMFKARVKKAMKKREKQIEEIQRNFRKAVEVRNKKVEKLKILHQKDLKQIKQIQKRKQKELEEYKAYFTSIAMKYIIGSLNLKNLRYDAENELMYADLYASNQNYYKKIYLKIPLNRAKVFKAKRYYQPIVIYEYNNNKLVLNNIKVDAYHAKFSEIDYEPEKISVELKDRKIDTNLAQNIFEPQNPNLKDKYIVIGSTITEDVDINIANFQDDIPNLLSNISKVSQDPKKWLFVIGAEKYDNTDSVIYSKRSAKIFAQVAQKSLGINDRNSYLLIGENATSGAIEDKLNRMLENVEKGDSIYFFYSGHGIPVLPNRIPYLLPKDKIPDYIGRSLFFKLTNIYNLLSNSKASKVIAIMDSCFSGSTDGKSVFKGVAGSVLIPKKVTFDHQKMVVLTAGRDKQFSNMYPKRGHRLFSYFVMKALLEGKRDVSAIYNAVYPHVKEVSNGFGDLKRQEPTIEGNERLRF